jgi:hypothetical protein
MLMVHSFKQLELCICKAKQFWHIHPVKFTYGNLYAFLQMNKSSKNDFQHKF